MIDRWWNIYFHQLLIVALLDAIVFPFVILVIFTWNWIFSQASRYRVINCENPILFSRSKTATFEKNMWNNYMYLRWLFLVYIFFSLKCSRRTKKKKSLSGLTLHVIKLQTNKKNNVFVCIIFHIVPQHLKLFLIREYLI